MRIKIGNKTKIKFVKDRPGHDFRYALNNKKIPVYNKGKEIRDWIHVDDHVDAILKIITKGIPGNTYNIGSKNQISNIKLIKKILFILGKKQNNYKNLPATLKFQNDT